MESKRKNRWGIVLAIVLVLLILCALFVFWFVRSASIKDDADDSKWAFSTDRLSVSASASSSSSSSSSVSSETSSSSSSSSERETSEESKESDSNSTEPNSPVEHLATADEPKPGECWADKYFEQNPGTINTVVMYCNGKLLKVGPPATDGTMVMHWENGRWVKIEQDGEDRYSGYACYTRETARRYNFEGELLSGFNVCSD